MTGLRSALPGALLAPLVVLAALPASVRGQAQARPSVRALQLDPAEASSFRLDGVLDEAAWRRAPLADGFRQREPDEGAPATEATEVRVLYDHETLYVGVLARDRAPHQIVARRMERDRIMRVEEFSGGLGFAGDDAVAILFDPFLDRRNAVVFATNPNGAEFEALITDEGREVNVDWRAVWRVAAARTADGWSAEFAIPFRTLRYPARDGEAAWGFNVYRVIRRKSEETLWSAWSRDNEGFHRVSRAGTLQGLADLPRPALNLEVKPYLLSQATQEPDAAGRLSTVGRPDAGLDVKWEVRPGLLLDLTANTDFAQVEVDDEQVNLTRFSLFFPEKRDFFLENSGVFEFGYRGFFEPPPFLLFFSRRIGLAEIERDGDTRAEAVPVIGGARLTGRLGGQTVGLLDMVTDAVPGVPRTNFMVARYKRDVSGNGYLGAMLTDRRSGDTTSTAGGVDWSLWPTPTLNVQGFVARTGRGGPGGEDDAYRVFLDYTSDRIGFLAGYLSIGPETDAPLGFVTRTDIRRTDGFMRVTPRPRALGLRKIDLLFGGQYIARTDGLVQDWGFGTGFGLEWDSGESASLGLAYGFTRLDGAFDLADEVPVPAGDYDVWIGQGSVRTSARRAVFVRLESEVQKIYEGTLLRVGGGVNVRPDAHLSLSLDYTRNRGDLPGGTFHADIVRVRTTYAFSTRLFVDGLLQYNSLANRVSANVRLNFIHRPGSDLFLVFNEERGSDDSAWDFASRVAALKLTYLLRI